MIHEGGCLCGAVRFRVSGPPLNVRNCHCRQCQKAMGSPYFARALFPQTAITLEGPVSRYATSDRIDRIFCPTCGSRIAAWRKNGSAAGIAIALFDDPNAFAPSEHIFLSEKIGWVHVEDGLPRYDQRAPE
jgi:hypothetical protein